MQKERASNRPVGGQLAITDNFPEDTTNKAWHTP
jgi:hypothetical protein